MASSFKIAPNHLCYNSSLSRTSPLLLASSKIALLWFKSRKMETILALCLGFSLSAACGFRVFVPPLIMSMAAISGNLTLDPQLAWIGTYPAAIILAVATVVEVAAYYIPVVDNFLDTLEVPAVFVAGTLVTASTLGELDPLLQWVFAVVAGGGAAEAVEGMTLVTRMASTGFTGGLANPLVSTMEVMTSVLLSLLALALPLFTAILVLGLLVFALNKVYRFFWRKPAANTTQPEGE